MVIKREHVLRDSYQQYVTTDDFDFHKDIKIYFVSEVAQDAGGVEREWITVLMRQLFNEDTGLFNLHRGKYDLSYFPNPQAKFSYPPGDCLGYFRFAGSVVAKALFD